jgi:hypothetical protein
MKDLNEKAASEVLSELYSRAGFDHWWDDISEEDQEEIERRLAEIIGTVYGV